MNQSQIYEKVSETLQSLFEIPEDDIKLETRLYQDLDLDSIDAVDLVVQLQNITGEKIAPEIFKEVRTVNDIVQAVDKIING